MEYVLCKISIHAYFIWTNQGDVFIPINVHRFFKLEAFKILSSRILQHTVYCCYL